MDNPANMNLELWLFLKNLIEIKKNSNAADQLTPNLLKTIQMNIADLIKQLENKVMPSDESTIAEYEFLRDINKEVFQYQKFLVCRVCNTHMNLCELELKAHINGQVHAANLSKNTNNGRLSAFDHSTLFKLSQCQEDIAGSQRSESGDVNVANAFGVQAPVHVCTNRPPKSDSENSNDSQPPYPRVKDFVNKPNIMIDRCSKELDLSVASVSENTKHDIRFVIAESIKDENIKSYIRNNYEASKKLIDLPFYENFKTILCSKLKCAVTIYGSRQYGISDTESDLNIFVHLNRSKKNKHFLNSTDLVVRNAAEEKLKQVPYLNIWKIEEDRGQALGNYAADNPLLGMRIKNGKLHCTLSFGTDIPVVECNLLKDIFQAQSICQPIIFYVKEWMKRLNSVLRSDEQIKFTNYLVTLLVIFFLQTQNLVPSIYSLNITNVNQQKACSVKYDHPICVTAKETITTYLLQFFQFYGQTYKLESHCLSLYYGAFVTKLFKRMHNEHFASMWENNSMCVEAILDSKRNVSAYIKKSEIQTFQRCCQITTEELANKPISNVRVSLALNESSLESAIRPTLTPEFRTQALTNGLLLANKLKNDTYMDITNELTKLLQEISPGTPLKCYVFGSRSTGIANVSCDLNILVDFGDSYSDPHKKPKRKEIKRLTQCGFEILSKNSASWYGVTMDKCTTIPALLVTHKSKEIRCNLIFGDCIHVVKNEFLESVLSTQKMCRNLIVYLQRWQEKINESAVNGFHVSNYVLTLLVIVLFQTKQLLPPIAALKPKKRRCGFEVCNRLDNCPSANLPFTKYLSDFFEFYGTTYNPMTHIISPYCGELVNRSVLYETGTLKPELEIIRKRRSIWKMSHVCLQDIFRITHNVTKNIEVEEMKSFQRSCRISANILRNQD